MGVASGEADGEGVSLLMGREFLPGIMGWTRYHLPEEAEYTDLCGASATVKGILCTRSVFPTIVNYHCVLYRVGKHGVVM